MKRNLRRTQWLLAAASICFAVLVLELLLRATPTPRFASNIVYDPVLGHLGPKDDFVDFCWTHHYYNSFGYRDKPYDIEKVFTDHKLRITALGDSITEATSATENDRWTHWLENILVSSTNQNPRVFNFAASDWGTYQEVLAYERDAKKVKPQIAVMEFLGLNDYINNSFAFAMDNQSLNDEWRPYIDVDHPSETLAVHPWKKFWRNHSSIFRYVNAILVNKYVYHRQILSRKEIQGCDPYKELFFAEPLDPRWQNAFRSTEEIAKRIPPLVEPGTKFLAVYFPSDLEIIDQQWEQGVRISLERCKPGRAIDRQAGLKRFEKTFKAAGIDTFSLWDVFAGAKNPAGLYDSSGHLSPEGHRIAGEAIAFHLIKRYGDVVQDVR